MLNRTHLPYSRCRVGRRARWLTCCALLLAAFSPQLLVPTGAHAFGVPLQTGYLAYPPNGPDGDLMLSRMHDSGARMLRFVLSWASVAPVTPPPGFDPANPDQPAYQWADVDRVVKGAVAHGLAPILDFNDPPSWGQSPPGSDYLHTDAAQLAQFIRAAARRYDGSHPGLPRVRYWGVWNEVNVSLFFQPQIQGGTLLSVDLYRNMINDVAAAVHGVHSDNVVIGGELFPNGINRPNLTAIAPLDFTRHLFCLSPGPRPRLVCQTKVNVDVWSVHPYTSGGPSTLPANKSNVWLSSLPALTSLVRAAQKQGTLVSQQQAAVWVSEFSWDTTPPDANEVPLALETRWVAEAEYRAWSAGISVFTWFELRDDPNSSGLFHSGLYFGCPGGDQCDTPKPALAAFRFPFVAYNSSRRRILIWGRTPGGVRTRVQIQWLRGRVWQRLGLMNTDGDGIFTARLRRKGGLSSKTGVLRAVAAGGASSPGFTLAAPRNLLVTPFAK